MCYFNVQPENVLFIHGVIKDLVFNNVAQVLLNIFRVVKNKRL